MKIFITGATGFIGRALCLQLQRDGHELRVLTRNTKRAASLLGKSVKFVPAYEFGLGQCPALEGCDAVINLAGEPVVGKRWSSSQKARLRRSRVGLTQNLVERMKEMSSPPPVFISASAVGYYGNRVDQEVDESAPAGSDFLATLCQSWEDAANEAQKLGCRVVTLRTGIVLGQGGGALSRLVPIFRMAAGGRLGDGHQSVPWIHLNDMIAIIQTALHNGSLHGAVNAVAPEAATNREFTKALASALHRPAVVPVPGILLRIAMGKAASTLLGGQRAIPAKLLSHSFTFLFPTLRSALHNLLQDDMGCTISNAESIPTSSYLQKRRPTYELRQQLLIQAPINEVMEFFSKAENLGLLTPPNVDFAMRSPSPIEMRDGAEIEYTIRIGKIPIHWKTQIETWLPTQRFVDVQMKGPYRAWWHEHAFRAEGETTIMEDRVLYALPLGILGRLAHRLHVSRMLLDIFTYRTRAISLRFGPPQLGREVSKPTLKLSTPRPTAVGALH